MNVNPEVATQATPIDWNLILLGLTAFILLVTAGILYYAARLQKENNRTTKKNLLHQALLNLQREYTSAEMLFAVQRLWELYESFERNREKLVGHYKKQLAITRDKIKDAEAKEKDVGEVVKVSLHYYGRLVSQFYAHLATIHEEKIIPERIIFDHWTPWDLDIIDKIIFPINSFMRKISLPDKPELDKETDILMRLYRASEKYRKGGD